MAPPCQRTVAIAFHPPCPPPGSARLSIERVAGRSAVTSSYATAPTRLLTPIPSGPAVWTYLASYGGGFVAGDQARLDLRLGPGTRCLVGTQSSSKVYRSHDSASSRFEVHAEVADGAILAVLPDFVQPFADASYSQVSEFRLHGNAGLVLVEGLTAGRAARGERWAFRRFESRTRIHCNQQVVIHDALRLDPEDGPLDGHFRLGRFNALALVLLVGPPMQDAADRLLDHFARQPITRGADVNATASRVRGGAILRLAAVEPQQAYRELRQHLAFLAGFLGDDPWARKW